MSQFTVKTETYERTHKMNKQELAKALKDAFWYGTMEDVVKAITDILDQGLNWVAVYSDGLWANNAEWIYNADREHGKAPSIIRVDTVANLYK